MNAGKVLTPGKTVGPARGGRAWLRAIWAAPVLLLALGAPFIGAGTLNWPAAWLYLGLAMLGSVASRVVMARAHPELVEERARFVGNEGTKGWDRIIVPILGIAGPLAIGLVAGLNRRLGWSPPLGPVIEALGAAALVLGLVFSTWAMATNRFFSSVVRIQQERGHRVVDIGPYRLMRHPGYAAGVLGEFGCALLLASTWALVPAGLVAAVYVLRTALEDRMLQAELPGYKEYAARVRYRLLPGVW